VINAWKIRTLADIADVKGGKRVPKGYKLQAEPTRHPYITVSNFTDDGSVDRSSVRYITPEVYEQIKRYTISSDDLYLSIAGTIGKTGSIPPDLDGACLTENACKLVLRPGIDRDFLHYFTKTDDFIEQAGANTRTAAQPKLALERLKTIKLLVPPTVSEQHRIVAILDKAFAAIATAKTNTEKNLQNARALFESHRQYLFTQLGPGWVRKSFGDVCEISSALIDPRQKEYLDLPHVGGANIVSKTGELVGLKTAREEGLISGKFAFDETMVLYSKIRPYLMKVARPHFRGVCSADIYPLSPRAGQVSRDYLPEFTDHANSGSARAGMPKLNRNHLFAFYFHLPPPEKQKHFASELDALSTETQRLASIYSRKLTALDELRKSLLHQAFTGQL
jgi:type I restriction enzyme S subunit